MSLRNNDFGLFSNSSSGGGGGGVSLVGICGCGGICVLGGSPVTGSGYICLCATGGGANGVEVLGAGTCSTYRCLVGNVASGDYSAALGGKSNTASCYYSSVVGGQANNSAGMYSFVGGGYGNTASNDNATVAGGDSNTVNNSNGFIGAGQFNTVSGIDASVTGGLYNTASAIYSSVVGGSYNTASCCYSFVGGGHDNYANDLSTTISGGAYNKVCGTNSIYGTIGGGFNNIIFPCSNYGTISGGYCNLICPTLGVGEAIKGINVIGGGYCNIVNNAYYSFIGGGERNTTSCYLTAIGGGYSNIANANYSSVFGGNSNQATAPYSFVGGGIINSATSTGSFIGSGYANTASGYYSTISGGYCNTASNSYDAVVGGYKNNANGSYSFVGGGFQNTAIGVNSAIGGGNQNILYGTATNIGGGEKNSILGNVVTSVSAYSSNPAISDGVYSGLTPVATTGIGTGGIFQLSISSGSIIDIEIQNGGRNYSGGEILTFNILGENIQIQVNSTGTSKRSSILGNLQNSIIGDSSSISGGYCNCICFGNNDFIGGGDVNLISCFTNQAVISGGSLNKIFNGGKPSNINGGNSNDICGGVLQKVSVSSFSGSVGGGTYTVNQGYSSGSGYGGQFQVSIVNPPFIGPSIINSVDILPNFQGYSYQVGEQITISGSQLGGTFPADNLVLNVDKVYTNNTSNIGGGSSNSLSGYYSTISGGYGNIIQTNRFINGETPLDQSPYYSNINGGERNTNKGTHSVIGGGGYNCIDGAYGTISGGYNNYLKNGQLLNVCFVSQSGYFPDGTYPVYPSSNTGIGVSGYLGITYNSCICTSQPSNIQILDGGFNYNYGDTICFNGTCFGGQANEYLQLQVTNVEWGKLNTISGGYTNTASGYYGFIGGGASNLICNSNLSGIGSGIGNLNCYSSISMISGGQENQIISAEVDFIGGGSRNKIFGGGVLAAVQIGNKPAGVPDGIYEVTQSYTDGIGVDAFFKFAIQSGTIVDTIQITDIGYGYRIGDTVTIEGAVLGGTTPADNIVLQITDVSVSRNSSIVGGSEHCVRTSYSVIGGGGADKKDSFNITCNGIVNTIGGGAKNITTCTLSTISGGFQNSARADSSFIGGGENNSVITGALKSISFNSFSGTVADGTYNNITISLAADGRGQNGTANFTFRNNNLISISVADGGWEYSKGVKAIINGTEFGYTWNDRITIQIDDVTNASYSSVVGGLGNTNSGYYGVIAGGTSNSLGGDSGNTIGGGQKNVINCYNTGFNTIGGGRENFLDSSSGTISGGIRNAIFNCSILNFATLSSGYGVDALWSYPPTIVSNGRGDGSVFNFCYVGNALTSVQLLCEGQSYVTGSCLIFNGSCFGGVNGVDDVVIQVDSVSNNKYSVIGGGWKNCIKGLGNISTISGGYCNTASCYFSTIGGGTFNETRGQFSTIGGGSSNFTQSYYSFVGGGNSNSASSTYSTVSGGIANTASGVYSTVSGGWVNTASGVLSFVGGGYGNAAIPNCSTISGGYTNCIIKTCTSEGFRTGYETISGGYNNYIDASCSSFIGGGTANFICGRNDGLAFTNNSSIAGGFCNRIKCHNFSFIGGGRDNEIRPLGEKLDYNTIGGGQGNIVCWTYSTVGGGGFNNIQGPNGTISGGYGNYIFTSGSGTISGGYANTVTATFATVSGGYSNTASGYASTVSGYDNTASGSYSFAAGGSNVASGNWSGVFGKNLVNICNNSFMSNCLRADNLCSMAVSGSICADMNGTILRVVSDGRCKTDINTIDYGLKSVLELKPISFYWCEDLRHNLGYNKQIGFIAQDVQKIIPEAVGEGVDGILSLDSVKIIPTMVKAIQELKNCVDYLENKINS